MTSLQSQATPEGSPPPALSDLHDRLDSLWISYLRHLDEYTSAQKELQQQLKSGYLSLSRANFNNRSGTRYGKDYFHDRAVATKRVRVQEERERVVLEAHPFSPEMEGDGKAGEGGGEGARQQPSPPATPGGEDKKNDNLDEDSQLGSQTNDTDNGDGSAPSAKPKLPLEADPLRWFGVLVPQELRTARASFSIVIDQSVAQTVKASRAMREVEVEIRKLRKDIKRAEKAEKR